MCRAAARDDRNAVIKLCRTMFVTIGAIGVHDTTHHDGWRGTRRERAGVGGIVNKTDSLLLCAIKHSGVRGGSLHVRGICHV